ncbi:MAG: ATP phosphoribosyltransferase [Candidatus Porifericomitaceae bacterium WSBS_2022_MAG_OTU9]
MTELVFAIPRGRLLQPILDLLGKVGIEPLRDLRGSRELMCGTSQPGLSLVVVRSSDVPVCVACGGADIGVTGSDVLLEKNCADVICDPIGLGIGKCRLIVAAPDANVLQAARLHKLRIATKFVNTSKRYFAQKHGLQVQIIELGGSVEIAPALGIADAIVDLVDTGNTLKANNLRILEKIADISTRVVINRASYKIKYTAIKPLLGKLAQVAVAGSDGTLTASALLTVSDEAL